MYSAAPILASFRGLYTLARLTVCYFRYADFYGFDLARNLEPRSTCRMSLSALRFSSQMQRTDSHYPALILD